MRIFKNTERRYSAMELGMPYFWTTTALNWINIFHSDNYKMILINSLQELVKRKQILIYAYVIMPNHLHLVWELKAMNGKEMPHASFNKFTAHQITKDLKANDLFTLQKLKVEALDRNYRLWQRDPMAIALEYKSKFLQKVRYIHNNPLQKKWQLVVCPEDYRWSSARFYKNGEDEFGILTHHGF